MAIRPSRTGNDGYTLIELLVVLAIIALLILAVPALVSALRPGVNAEAAANTVALDLRAAREAAIEGNRETRIAFEFSSGRYFVVSGAATHALPAGLSLSFRASDGRPADAIIRFFPDGSSSGGTVVIGSGHSRHRIVADWLTGRVSRDD